MYRIRLVSGDEAQYGSIDELGAAVAAGIVTDKAEIFHARAEKWLPIASHPHFKLAKDKVSGAAARPAARPSAPSAPVAPRPSVVAPGTLRAAATASGVKPLSASGQRPAIVTGSRPGATGSRPQRPITAPRPAQPRPPAPAPSDDLALLRADAAIDTTPTESRPIPEIQLEQSPTIEEPRVVTPARNSLPFIEQPPAQVELVSDEAAPAASSARSDIIHPDRAMPAVPVKAERDHVRELPSVEIPAPVHDFAPPAPAEQPVHAHADIPAQRPSRTPIFIGIGVAAAAAIAAGFIFTRKPDAPEQKPIATQAAPAPSAAAPVQTTTMAQDAGSVTNDPSKLQTAQGEDGSSRRRKSSDQPGGADGLEPPPSAPVIPAAPSVKGIADAAALPTVDAGAPGMSDNQKALERTVREIDSSMRRESGKSGGSTR